MTEFQALNTGQRDEVLYKMLLSRISMKQASRITGISYGVIRKVLAKAAQLAGCTLKSLAHMAYPHMGYPRGLLSGHLSLART